MTKAELTLLIQNAFKRSGDGVRLEVPEFISLIQAAIKLSDANLIFNLVLRQSFYVAKSDPHPAPDTQEAKDLFNARAKSLSELSKHVPQGASTY